MDSNHRRLRQLSYSQPHLATLVTALIVSVCNVYIYGFQLPIGYTLFSSLLSDSNQRPRDYKSRALAN